MHCLRLVSAYQDKVVKNGDAHETWKHWKHWKQSSNDTFTADFVNEVISSVDTGCRYRYINNLNTSSIIQARANTAPQPLSPFIVLSSSPTNCPVDSHWRPYVSRCGYCSTNYTLIARMDMFAGDLAKISSLAGVSTEQ